MPRSSHGIWKPADGRASAVDLIVAQNDGRLPWLVPIRHHRMAQSPLAFYRGAATVMAHDLASTPATGIWPQICGDAHLSNFGAYGAPDRGLVFDINDFDETLQGPWEWDLKRLAASFAITARNSRIDGERELSGLVVTSYRDAMQRIAEMPTLDAWYLRIEFEDILTAFTPDMSKKDLKRASKWATKTKAKGSLYAFGQLGEVTPAGVRIVSQPPDVIPLRVLTEHLDSDQIRSQIDGALKAYVGSLPDHMAALVSRYRLADIALKVVGVGSVGTRCFIVLLEGKGQDDLLFLQVKEATGSVLESVLAASRYSEAGRRVVEGQRLMQTATDSFLGWTTDEKSGRSYYWRQLKDMKGAPDVESMDVDSLSRFARLCGLTLARSHARSSRAGDIAAYIGKGDALATAIAEFSAAYADQNDRDYSEFIRAIRTGAIEARE